MFELHHGDINKWPFEKRLLDQSIGAVVAFEGRVRNHNQGRAVLSLEYEAYEALAIKEGNKIIDEARAKFHATHLYCIHTLGHLKLGDLAVWVQAASSHRAEAFRACQYAIDEIKKRVPIWKCEHYPEGEPVWVNCPHCNADDHQHKKS